MKVYLVDDDLSFGVELETKIKQIGCEFVGRSVSFDHARHIVPTKKPDIIICDVNLDQGDKGKELAKKFESLHVPMVFVTGESDENIYNTIKDVSSNFKYLVKPFDKLSLKSILDDLHTQSQLIFANHFIQGEYLYIKKNNLFERVVISEILYLQAEGNYITLVLSDKKFVFKNSLIKLLQLQKFGLFMRVHRNYAVNKRHIKSVSFAHRKLYVDAYELPFGRTYAKDVRSFISSPFSDL